MGGSGSKKKGKSKEVNETIYPAEQFEGGSDVMLSFHGSNKAAAQKLRDGLEECGLSVWMDKTGKYRHNGRAIVDCQAFCLLVSKESCSDKICKDDLALAYISKKPIFPVSITPMSSLAEAMDFGIKLTLSSLQIHDFSNKSKIPEELQKLSAAIKESVKPTHIQKQKFESEIVEPFETPEMVGDFWDRHFTSKDTIEWKEFEKEFRKDYRDDLATLFGDQTNWIVDWLKQSMFVNTDSCKRTEYHDFVKEFSTDEVPFWTIVQMAALQAKSIKNVFDMTSNVRIDAVENLAKFQNEAVIRALTDLLGDRDPNVRAVACISLGRVKRKGPASALAPAMKLAEQRMMLRLKDEDRLVREASCLALAALQSVEAIPGIVHLWRNDAISTVRAAALISLERIGGPEADKAMHMTKVLTEELSALQQV